jgi:2-oxoisovalerate dehydrogenase E1 component
MRPVAEIMWADFLLVALDQLVNQAANIRYVNRGERSAPMVVRCQQGAAPGSCAQHSQSLEALLAHVPGLRVGLPATPHDAYAMLRAAIADDDPCVVIESRVLYQLRGPVDLDAPVELAAGASKVRDGSDLALLTWGRMRHDVLRAAEALAAEGIEASITDLRWVSPLDAAAIAEAVSGPGRVLVVHEANTTGGVGAEVVARISNDLFDLLDAPPTRLGTPDVRMPAAPVLQAALIPDVAAIVAAARDLVSA